jgi:hypothetical protein
MKEQLLLPTFEETIPDYRETKALALKWLREKQNFHKQQKSRVLYAYLALGSATRDECYEFLISEWLQDLGPQVKMSSVLARTHELIFEDKKLMCIGSKPGANPDGSPVEIIGPGEDKRIRIPHAKLATVDPVVIRESSWPWVLIGILIGYLLGKLD